MSDCGSSELLLAATYICHGWSFEESVFGAATTMQLATLWLSKEATRVCSNANNQVSSLEPNPGIAGWGVRLSSHHVLLKANSGWTLRYLKKRQRLQGGPQSDSRGSVRPGTPRAHQSPSWARGLLTSFERENDVPRRRIFALVLPSFFRTRGPLSSDVHHRHHTVRGQLTSLPLHTSAPISCAIGPSLLPLGTSGRTLGCNCGRSDVIRELEFSHLLVWIESTLGLLTASFPWDSVITAVQGQKSFWCSLRCAVLAPRRSMASRTGLFR